MYLSTSIDGRLASSSRRVIFFIWAHYYDPHDPYFDVPGFKAEDDSDKAKYEAIARYTDHHLGRLIDGLKTRGLMKDTIVVLTSDHGDEFMEHGHRFHGRTLYEKWFMCPFDACPRIVCTSVQGTGWAD